MHASRPSPSVPLQILSEWFGRTIIRSCTKLSYEHAQSMIESPAQRIPEEELPPISPEHTSEEVHQAVLNLHRIAKELRKQRFLDGALRLDQVSHFPFSVQTTGRLVPEASVRQVQGGILGPVPLSPFPSHCTQTVFAEPVFRPPSWLHRHRRPDTVSPGRRVGSALVALRPQALAGLAQ